MIVESQWRRFKLKDGPPSAHVFSPDVTPACAHRAPAQWPCLHRARCSFFFFFATNTRSVTFQCPSLSQQLCKQLMFRCTLGGLWTGAAAANMSTVCYLKNEPSQQQGWVQSAPGPPFALIWRHHIDTQIAKSCQSMMIHTSVWGSK